MRTFTHSLDIGGSQARFLFSPVLTKEATKYFVTVAGLAGQVVNFEMKQTRHATWKVLHPAPQWIAAMEAELGQLLNTKNKQVTERL